MAFPSRNPFIKFTCQVCGWNEVTYQPGDCILSTHICPQCDSENIKMSSASPVESAAAFPVKYAQHLLKI